MHLTPVKQKFVLHWGEMGTRWGVNRTVSQIHALLFLAEQPMNAEDIAETLVVARSNVSNSLKELQNWGLVKVVHVLGDRRDHFETSKDVWQLFRTIVDERKRREFDPTLTVLRDCVMEQGEAGDEAALQRMQDVLDFMETLTAWIKEMERLPPETLMKILKLGARVQKMLGRADD
ncbi:DNA-binding transcriptional regulator GbsR, MarR family [Andreprevotia lacus DSM 23236]|jgi:DNA-binding transcriptional regulator GbsR (MarR family)|uniref:HTH-type transcriptional regulator n=1 Tax=Andreprevotia lacus DSM 23236 TaxID=1121001 RepID=A0A1W1XIP5_9NEIS|nr:MarR family transcriptional regulator [Andreprevotia lacus]SMC23692.1 DNA-binding transcriptional regulator GbsR, MarR family [Andreprevotia lacus DSM 23236]